MSSKKKTEELKDSFGKNSIWRQRHPRSLRKNIWSEDKNISYHPEGILQEILIDKIFEVVIMVRKQGFIRLKR